MGKKKNKKVKSLEKQIRRLFKGSTFSGNMLSNILAAMLMEWYEERRERRKEQKAIQTTG